MRWITVGSRQGLEIQLRPRAGRRPRCSQCHRPRPGYDTLAPRRFEFVPLWNLARALELALYHTLGDLPEPIATHRFN